MSIDRNRAWKYLEDLSFPRVTGTEGEKKAAKMLKAICDKQGVKAVIENYDIETCDVKTASLSMVGGKEYKVIGVGNTGNTPAKGITAPFQYIEDGTSDASLVGIKGKIALISGNVMPKLAKTLMEKGAVGFVTVYGSFWDEQRMVDEPRTRSMRQAAKIKLPGVVLHIRDFEDLVKNHPDAQLTIKLSSSAKKATAQNVIAEIPGTECPDEVLVLSAHYDSVIYALGSWDNATGSVCLLEMMHHFAQNPPKRTVRFLWCGSEEIGLVGSRKYCEAHKDELSKIIYNVNIDMVGATLGKHLFMASADESVLNNLVALANIKGFSIKADLGMYSSDSSSFAASGVPAASFGQQSCRGGAEIHNYRDDMDRLDPDTFIKANQFILDYVSPIVDAVVNPIPRTFAPKVKETLEKRKAMMAEMEGANPEEDKKADKKPAKKADKKPAKKPAAKK